jgi:aspartyl aminopeptidase
LQTHGGGLWNTWFDRDLSIAGKTTIRNKTTNVMETRLFRVKNPIIFIPNLPIHLTSTRNKFEWNDEINLKGITGTTFFKSLGIKEAEETNLSSTGETTNKE